MSWLSFFLLAVVATASPIVRRQYLLDDTENQLTDGTACREVTILFARGTTEEGNVGELVGPPFFQAVADIIGSDNVAVQGVSPFFSS